jgi:hypothetical protein
VTIADPQRSSHHPRAPPRSIRRRVALGVGAALASTGPVAARAGKPVARRPPPPAGGAPLKRRPTRPHRSPTRSRSTLSTGRASASPATGRPSRTSWQPKGAVAVKQAPPPSRRSTSRTQVPVVGLDIVGAPVAAIRAFSQVLGLGYPVAADPTAPSQPVRHQPPVRRHPGGLEPSPSTPLTTPSSPPPSTSNHLNDHEL